MNWEKYAPYFTEAEFRCKHTGLCKMQEEFMDVLLAIRKEFGAPLRVTSGYRDKTHPIEARKVGTGEHTLGAAVDFAVQGADALRLLDIARKHGIHRIGVQQKGDDRFIHLGWGGPGLASPALWSY